MGQFGMGQAVPREEEPRLLRGLGEYIADATQPRKACGQVLRSPHAQARLKAIDTRAAAQMPDVLALYTAAGLQADGICHSEMPVTPEKIWRAIRDAHSTARNDVQESKRMRSILLADPAIDKA